VLLASLSGAAGLQEIAQQVEQETIAITEAAK
jgi:hypothetical protein